MQLHNHDAEIIQNICLHQYQPLSEEDIHLNFKKQSIWQFMISTALNPPPCKTVWPTKGFRESQCNFKSSFFIENYYNKKNKGKSTPSQLELGQNHPGQTLIRVKPLRCEHWTLQNLQFNYDRHAFHDRNMVKWMMIVAHYHDAKNILVEHFNIKFLCEYCLLYKTNKGIRLIYHLLTRFEHLIFVIWSVMSEQKDKTFNNVLCIQK